MMRPIPEFDTNRAPLSRDEYLALANEARQIRAQAVTEAITAVGGWFKRLFAGLIDAHQRRKAYAELYGLDDRMLRDMGLSRGELWSAVEGRTGLHANDNVGIAPAANENAPRKGAGRAA